MLRISRQTPPKRDAARLRALVARGYAVEVTGDARQLRRVAALLGDDVDAFVGDTESGEVLLHVSPTTPVTGALLYES